MSLALIVQQEANTVGGGSIQGYISGTDSSAVVDTFYGRRLTDLLINEDSTISSFTASTGGSGSASTAGQWVLTPGTYRIEADLTYCYTTNATNFIAGLYNVTDGVFEQYNGPTPNIPILATVASGANVGNSIMTMLASFTVASVNKTFQIRHKASDQTTARGITCCGADCDMTGTNVNSAAALNLYAIIKILKTS